MSAPQCKCGRFVANAKPVLGWRESGWTSGPYIEDVVGDCSRCGVGVTTLPDWHWSWDAWTWEGDDW